VQPDWLIAAAHICNPNGSPKKLKVPTGNDVSSEASKFVEQRLRQSDRSGSNLAA
jgi:hypothetical protein